jgi:hypothetical protein
VLGALLDFLENRAMLSDLVLLKVLSSVLELPFRDGVFKPKVKTCSFTRSFYDDLARLVLDYENGEPTRTKLSRILKIVVRSTLLVRRASPVQMELARELSIGEKVNTRIVATMLQAHRRRFKKNRGDSPKSDRASPVLE